MATRNEIEKLLMVLSAIFPDRKLSPEAILIYTERLQDLSYDTLVLAVKQCQVELKFFPAISEIRERAFAIYELAENIPSAAEAWENVAGNLRYVGWPGPVNYSHPLVERTVYAMGGWMYLCENDMNITRPHFLRIYESFLTGVRKNAYLLPEIKNHVDKLRAEKDKIKLPEKAGEFITDIFSNLEQKKIN